MPAAGGPPPLATPLPVLADEPLPEGGPPPLATPLPEPLPEEPLPDPPLLGLVTGVVWVGAGGVVWVGAGVVWVGVGVGVTVGVCVTVGAGDTVLEVDGALTGLE